MRGVVHVGDVLDVVMERPHTLTGTARIGGKPAEGVRVVISGRDPEKLAAAKAAIGDLSWLSGAWVGTRSSGSSIEERWTPPLGGAMLGVSRTVSRGAMRAFEFLRVVEREEPVATELGPSKKLTKALAEFLFDDEHAVLRLDMSEYQSKKSVALLLGESAGRPGRIAAGYDSCHGVGTLLCDEIEKAHPDVFNILLQLLDDGRLTDNQGRTVDFKNTVIVMTSNIGSQLIQSMVGQDSEDIKDAVRITDKFSGAEIEQTIVEASYAAVANVDLVKTGDKYILPITRFRQAADTMNPITKIDPVGIEKIREFGINNFCPAAAGKDILVTKVGRQFQLEMEKQKIGRAHV